MSARSALDLVWRLVTWPPVAATLLACACQPLLTDRYRMVKPSVVIGAAIVGLVCAVASFAAKEMRRSRLERLLSVVTIIVLSALTVNLILDLAELLARKDLSSRPLLMSAIALWLCNVFSFSLWYWYVDGHGRNAQVAGDVDWIFPQSPTRQVAPKLNYFDYLFLAFNTATAFSPTDVVPVTTRARLLMMLESAVSLMTLAVVAARAVNLSG